MKKNVLVFGLVSGIIIMVMMFFAVSMCYNDPDFEPNMILVAVDGKNNVFIKT